MKDNYINKDKLQVGGACLYFIREELRAEFLSEVKFARVRVEEIYPQVFLNKETTRLYWVLDYWPNLQEISFTSISDASKKIRAQGKATAYVGLNAFRRGALIADALKIKKYNTISFP
ncbi:MAG TPA: hypothetical protein PLY93_02425, partial [Turneriella sp.]|nr:hypothetical protein [Turneriella sp.]